MITDEKTKTAAVVDPQHDIDQELAHAKAGGSLCGIGGGGGGLICPLHGTDDFCFRPVGLASSTAMPASMASRIESQNRVGMGSSRGAGWAARLPRGRRMAQV